MRFWFAKSIKKQRESVLSHQDILHGVSNKVVKKIGVLRRRLVATSGRESIPTRNEKMKRKLLPWTLFSCPTPETGDS
jgi:hypothetical protein